MEIEQKKEYWLYVLDNAKVELKLQVKGKELTEALFKILEMMVNGKAN